jgi:hypothetical protein
MYAVINHIDGSGISVCHTRQSQADANKLAVDIICEQVADDQHAADSPHWDSLRAEAIETLQAHGVYTGSGYDVTVIEVSSSDGDDAPVTLTADAAVQKLVEAINDLDDADDIADALQHILGGKAVAQDDGTILHTPAN